MRTLTPKQRRNLGRIVLSAVLLAAVHFLPPLWQPFLLYLIPYGLIGWDVLWKALRNIAHGQVFDENFLMALATVGAFFTGEYAEAVFVMLFYQVGELFQDYAVGKSRRSIAALMDIRPEEANLERPDGSVAAVDPEDVAVGDIIVVRPGERVPLDGVVLEGSSTLDTAALTGESIPRDAAVGDSVLSGCINQRGVLRLRVTKPFADSTVSRILDLVENASEKKSRSEQFITRFARYYTPCVVLAAAALFAIPALLLALLPAASLPAFLLGTAWSDWLHRALIFLVISCPCALVISVPLSFFGGIGRASQLGILVKGSNYFEALAHTELVVFDKTGTLTQGTFSVTAVHPAEAAISEDQLLTYAALAEQWSDHPISQSLRAACPAELDTDRVADVEEIAGMGVTATVDGHQVAVGNSRLMERLSVNALPCELPGTLVHVTVDGFYAGHIVISDQPKPDAKAAIAALRKAGVRQVVMLTGDTQEVAAAMAAQLGVDQFRAELLPADKVSSLEALLHEVSPRGKLAFVGDGINDAPVLSRADVGIAMGAMGADAAIEAADVVLMDDQPSKIAVAISIARKTVAIVHQNIVFALGVKAVVLLLGALGFASMWAAVFADVGVAFLAILNAMRALYRKP